MDNLNEISTLDAKRNKRNKAEQKEPFRFGQQRNTRNKRPVGSCSCSDAPNPSQDLATLKAEVLHYLDGYTTRGMRSEGSALDRLRKAAKK